MAALLAGLKADPTLQWVAGGVLAGAFVGRAAGRLFGDLSRGLGLVSGIAIAIPWLVQPLGMSMAAEFARFGLPALGGVVLVTALVARRPDVGSPLGAIVLASVIAIGVLAVTLLGRFGHAPAVKIVGLDIRYLLLPTIVALPTVWALIRGRPGQRGDHDEEISSLALIVVTFAAATTVLWPDSLSPAIFLAWLGILIFLRRLSVVPLLERARRLQRRLDVAVASAEAERDRLAAELHDDALQELATLIRHLDRTGDDDGATQARVVAARLRAVCADLRLLLLDDLGAGPALEWLVARIGDVAEGEVVLERRDRTRPPAEIELAVFRVAQQALANAVEHGRPPIRVLYAVDPVGNGALTVDDAGPGIDADARAQAARSGRFGILTMEQRAAQIGGQLRVSRRGDGTEVRLSWAV